MKDLLKRYLTPDDDGGAFAEAVMLRASGALHRRRNAADAVTGPLWVMLERWARPWVVVALIGIAFAASVRVLPTATAASGGGEMAVGADALLTASAPDADLGFSIGN